MRNKSKLNRQGLEVVELAIVLPLMLLLTFGTLELCEGIFLRQKLEVAAHEGARIAIRKTATKQEIDDAVADYLDARGLVYDDIGTAVVSTPDPGVAAELTPITVQVTLSVDDNLRMPIPVYRFLVGRDVVGEVTMFKEYAR